MLRKMHSDVGDLLTFIGTMILALAAMFGLVILSTIVGAVTGWCVGLLFGDAILGVLSQLGIHYVSVAQLGAFLGFVAPFFRAHGSK